MGIKSNRVPCVPQCRLLIGFGQMVGVDLSRSWITETNVVGDATRQKHEVGAVSRATRDLNLGQLQYRLDFALSIPPPSIKFHSHFTYQNAE